MTERLTPAEVASLDPFGLRRNLTSEQSTEVLSNKTQEEIIIQETTSLRAFFGIEYELPPLPDQITPEKIAYWTRLKMDLHFLPWEPMSPYKDFPGWKIKPNEKFYQKIREGSLPLNSLHLPGKWILIDTRDKPNQQKGRLIYDHDFIAPILKKLIQEGKIKGNEDFSARDNISWGDYWQFVSFEIAEVLKVRPHQVRLPRAIEFNFLGNAYYPQWGETDSWEWLDETLSSNYYQTAPLVGGFSRKGGLAAIDVSGFLGPSTPSKYIGFRPLVEF